MTFAAGHAAEADFRHPTTGRQWQECARSCRSCEWRAASPRVQPSPVGSIADTFVSVGQNVQRNWCGDTARLMASWTPVCSQLIAAERNEVRHLFWIDAISLPDLFGPNARNFAAPRRVQDRCAWRGELKSIPIAVRD